MTIEEFQNELIEAMEFPFDISEVMGIETNCGSIWVNLQNGHSYYIMIEKCEDGNDE